MLTQDELTKNNYNGKFLYKYSTMNNWDYFFKNWTIRFTPPLELNDPYECEPVIRYDTSKLDRNAVASIVNHQIFPESYLRMKQYGSLNLAWIANNIELLCHTYESNPELMYQIALYAKSELPKIYGVLCLSEQFNNLLMWAHYGDMHKGFVIEVDAQHDFFNHSLVNVEYSEIRPTLSFQDCINKTHYFHRKSIHWSYEEEWRSITLLSPISQREFIDIEKGIVRLPKNMVKSVIFGAKVQESTILEKVNMLRNQPNSSHIQFKQMQLDEVKYSLKLVDIETA